MHNKKWNRVLSGRALVGVVNDLRTITGDVDPDLEAVILAIDRGLETGQRSTTGVPQATVRHNEYLFGPPIVTILPVICESSDVFYGRA